MGYCIAMSGKRRSSVANSLRRSTPLVPITFILQCLAVGDSKTSLDVSSEFALPLAIPPLSPWQAPVSTSASDEPSRPANVYAQHHLQLDPPYLDFKEQPVGMPKIETVEIYNLHEKQSLHLNSISGNTLHFHSSFFEAKVVPAGQKTVFQVIFLARMIGNAENTLYLHTGQGVIPFQVFGTGVPNPYRLRPFLGARVPVNTSYSPLINIHNPHSSTLKVMEMYTSHGDLHLELPATSDEPLKKIWEIGPYETKAVMRANFVGRVVNNHTAFIRIRTNMEEDKRSDMLILPVEVEVTDNGGIFSSLEVLDFGTLRTMDGTKSLRLQLLNTGPKSVEVKSIEVEPSNEAISVYFQPVVLKSGFPPSPVSVATIQYTASKANVRRLQHGKVIFSTNDGKRQTIEIPYQATVLRGALYATLRKTAFLLRLPPFDSVIHDIELTNTFDFPLAIFGAKFPSECSSLFEVTNFSSPVVIPSSATMSPLSVCFTANSSETELSTVLRLFTNASVFTVPVHTYSGRVKYHVDGGNEDVLDYGTITTRDELEMSFRIVNRNPVEIMILGYNSTLRTLKVTLLGTQPSAHRSKGLPNVNRGKQPQQSKQRNVSVMSGYSAVFLVKLKPPDADGTHSGEILVRTTHMDVHVPVYYKTAFGVLETSPSVLKFKNLFPGRVETKVVTFSSTFKETVRVNIVEMPDPLDPRFTFILNKAGTLVAAPGKTRAGWLKVDPLQGKPSSHYVGLTAKGVSGRTAWLSRLTLQHEAAVADTKDREKLIEMWENLEKTEQNKFSVTYKLRSDTGVTFSMSAQAVVTWPLLPSDDTLKFPLTHIGNSTVLPVRVDNPADVPLVVQAVMLSSYPNPELALDLLSERMDIDSYVMNTSDHRTFRLTDTKVFHTTGLSPETAYSPPVHSELGVSTSEAAVTILVEPRSYAMIDIEFSPRSQKIVTSVVILRNNLTIMDGVIVQGQGVLSMFTLEGRDPGNDHTPLHFNLTAAYLAERNETKVRSFTMRKVFTAKNTGQLPIHVVSIEISGRPCTGYGFSIRKCQPFVIKPNKTYRIEIDFTPDFTLSRISRQLDIVTEEGLHLEFNLLATLPHHLLPVYLASFPRPSWEPYVTTSLIIVVVVILLAVLVHAYFTAMGYTIPLSAESEAAMYARLRQFGAPLAGQVFDLNKITGVKEYHLAGRNRKKESVETIHMEQDKEEKVSEKSLTSTETEKKTEKPVQVEVKDALSCKSLERQPSAHLSAGERDHQTVNQSAAEMGRARVYAEKEPVVPVGTQKTSVLLSVEKEKEKQCSSGQSSQESDVKRPKQTKKLSAALPILNDSVIKEAAVESVPTAAVFQAEVTQKEQSKGVSQNGSNTQTKHELQRQQKEEKAVTKDVPDAEKVEKRSKPVTTSKEESHSVSPPDLTELSSPVTKALDESTKKEVAKPKRKLKPGKVRETSAVAEKTDPVSSVSDSSVKHTGSRKPSHVTEKDGMKELDQLLIGNMPKSPVVRRGRLKSDEEGKRSLGVKRQESGGEKRKLERRQETGEVMTVVVGEKQEREIKKGTDVLAGCFTKPPGLKLEPLSGLSQRRLATDPMLLEDTSIVEMGRSVMATELAESRTPSSPTDLSRGPEAAMNGFATLSDSKHIEKTTKSKPSVASSKSSLAAAATHVIAKETSQKLAVKETKEPKPRVSKSVDKQGSCKGKNDTLSVDEAADPHAIATVIAASVAASTVKQGKSEEHLLTSLSPRHAESVTLSPGGVSELGDRERNGELEKQGHSKGKARQTDGKGPRKNTKSPSKPNRLLKSKEKKSHSPASGQESEYKGMRKLSSEQLFERYLSCDLPEFIPKQTQMTVDTAKTDGETDSSSSDKQSPISVEMLDSHPQPPTSTAVWIPGSFPVAKRQAAFTDIQQEEREVSPPESLVPEGMTPEIYFSLLAQPQRKRKFGSGAGLEGLASPTLGNNSNASFPGDRPSSLSDFPLSNSFLDDAESDYWLAQMALRRQGTPPDFLDDPPVLSRSNSNDARSPSPHGRGDLSDTQGPVLYHHGSRVMPRRRNNPIWDQAVGRSGHGLIRMSQNLRDDIPYDNLSFSQEKGSERRRRQAFTRGRSPDWMSYLNHDFDPSLLTDLPPASSGYLWGDPSDLDSLSMQQEEMIDALRRRRSSSRRIRQDIDQEDYFTRSRLPSSGRRTSPHADPPPLLSEYYQRSAALALSERGVPDSEVWSAAIEKQRREQSKFGPFPTGHQGRLRYPAYPGDSVGLWDTPLSSEPMDEGWNTRLSSIWSRDPTELAPQRPSLLKDHGAIGEDKVDITRQEMSRDSSSSDLEIPTAPNTVESEKGSPQDPPPTSPSYDPFLSNIWGPSTLRSWMPKEGGE